MEKKLCFEKLEFVVEYCCLINRNEKKQT